MTPLLAGDDIISDDDPARVLIVDQPEGVGVVREALGEYDTFLKIDVCHDLRSALQRARTVLPDVALLALELPDSWPEDTYDRFRREIRDPPILVLTRYEQAEVAARKAPRRPFCIINMATVNAALIRRLIVSACLFSRAGGSSGGFDMTVVE